MALYLCRNFGRCAFADGRKRFTCLDRGTPVCPACNSENVSLATSFGLPSLFGVKSLLVVGVFFVAAYFFAGHDEPTTKNGSSSAQNGNGSRAGDRAAGNPPHSSDVSKLRQPPANSTRPVFPELFGLIEIGGKGVKGIVVDLVLTEHEEGCQQSEDAFAECVRKSIRKQYDPYNVNPIDKASIPDTVKAAKKFMDDMTGTYSVDPRQIYLVGSSSISNKNLVPHRDQLKEELEMALDKHGEMDFVTPEREGELGFYGVLNLIPEKWRERRKKYAVVLDIGSGDTKGGYLEKNDGHETFVPVSVPWGTKSFSNAVDKELDKKENKIDDWSVKAAPFANAASELRKRLLRPAIHQEVSRKPGLINHDRVYLIGGIAWATSTLIQPYSKSAFPVMHPQYFDTLYNRAKSEDAVKKFFDENPFRKTYPDIEKVSKAFTPDNLVAGLEILRTFSEEMHFGKKNLFFIRDSLYAWPLGYIRKRCEDEHTCPPSKP